MLQMQSRQVQQNHLKETVKRHVLKAYCIISTIVKQQTQANVTLSETHTHVLSIKMF